MKAATGHVHADHLTKVDNADATCNTDGNKEVATGAPAASSSRMLPAATEITDHSSVVIPATGHSYYLVQNSDEAQKIHR